MNASLRAIEFYLPPATLSSEELASEFPEWTAQKIEAKTGIRTRHIAAAGVCASDMAAEAARRLFQSGACRPRDVDFILLCTQSPDYFLPTTACLLQDRLGLPITAGALDFNLGCSGYVYGLGLAQGLIASGQARNVLLLTSETYSKYLQPRDKSVRAIFGDAAAATLVIASPQDPAPIGPFVYGSDGSGAQNLIVENGGWRSPAGCARAPQPIALHMDGAEIFAFTLRMVPTLVKSLLERSRMTLDDIDLFVFHQANEFMLRHLRDRLQIPAERFFMDMAESANTVSSTIPIALKLAEQAGRLQSGDVVMLVGFGVGYSWGATLIRWP